MTAGGTKFDFYHTYLLIIPLKPLLEHLLAARIPFPPNPPTHLSTYPRHLSTTPTPSPHRLPHLNVANTQSMHLGKRVQKA